MNRLQITLLILAVGFTMAIKNDSDIFLGEVHYPGLIPINDARDDIFYWLF